MYCAMRLSFQSLCGRITTRSLWDNCAIRLDQTSSCLSLAAQAKLLDLIYLMGKKFEAPKKSSYSNDELLLMRNKDMISLLDIFEPVCDDRGCQCEHHKKMVELMQKSKEIKNACHHEVAAWQTVSEGSNIKFEIWKERMVITEAAVMRFCSQLLSEDLSFEADSQSGIVVDRLNAINPASEIVSMNRHNKLKNHLKKEHMIKWLSIGSTVRPTRTIIQSGHHCYPKLRVEELMSFPFMWTELGTIQKLYILSNHVRNFSSCAPYEDALKKLKIGDWKFVLCKEIQMWKYEKAMVNKNLTLPKGNSGLLILVRNIIEHKIEYKMFQGWKSIPIFWNDSQSLLLRYTWD